MKYFDKIHALGVVVIASLLIPCVVKASSFDFEINLDLIALKPYPPQISTQNSSSILTTRQSTAPTFYLSDIHVNWTNALSLCTSQELTLVTPSDLYADNDLKNFLSARGTFAVWTSGSDRASRGTYRWETNLSFMQYSNWRGRIPPPSNVQGCVSAANKAACGMTSNGAEYAWDKTDCATLLYAVCK